MWPLTERVWNRMKKLVEVCFIWSGDIHPQRSRPKRILAVPSASPDDDE